jgi:hypothetical protein
MRRIEARRLRVAIPALVCALLTGCVGTDEAQPVKSEADAIRMAKERCAFSRPVIGAWHARLHDGQWHVWFVPDLDPKEPAMGQVDIWIQAKDGSAGDCDHA